MKRFTYRVDDYTYNKIKVMAEFYNKTMTAMITELIQIGYLEKEKLNTKNRMEISYENKNIY